MIRYGVCGLFMITLICAALLASSAWAAETDAAPAEGDLAPLDIKLPEPSYAGTPLNYWSEHLEITFKKREPYMAPKDAVNLAKDKAVTSSAKPSVGKLPMVTDGDKSAAEESFMELPSGIQWVQVDLGAEHELYAIVLWHYHAAERVYFDTVCQLSNDPDFIKDVKTVFNNDFDNSSKLGVGEHKEYIEGYEGKLIDVKGNKARYIRFYSNGNTSDEMNHYIEVEAYGKPAN